MLIDLYKSHLDVHLPSLLITAYNTSIPNRLPAATTDQIPIIRPPCSTALGPLYPAAAPFDELPAAPVEPAVAFPVGLAAVPVPAVPTAASKLEHVLAVAAVWTVAIPLKPHAELLLPLPR